MIIISTILLIFIGVEYQSTIRKKMMTGTFTYNALHMQTLQELIKTKRKIVSHLNSIRAMLLV